VGLQFEAWKLHGLSFRVDRDDALFGNSGEV